MAIVRPLVDCPPDAAVALQPPMLATGLVKNTVDGLNITIPSVIAAAGAVLSETLDLSGYDLFGIAVRANVAAGLKLLIQVIDPIDATTAIVELDPVQVTGGVGAFTMLYFGRSQPATDVPFYLVKLKIANTTGANVTLTGLSVLWCSSS